VRIVTKAFCAIAHVVPDRFSLDLHLAVGEQQPDDEGAEDDRDAHRDDHAGAAYGDEHGDHEQQQDHEDQPLRDRLRDLVGQPRLRELGRREQHDLPVDGRRDGEVLRPGEPAVDEALLHRVDEVAGVEDDWSPTIVIGLGGVARQHRTMPR
jgi:hypothetical protein